MAVLTTVGVVRAKAKARGIDPDKAVALTTGFVAPGKHDEDEVLVSGKLQSALGGDMLGFAVIAIEANMFDMFDD